jgi:hypothetical protein
MHKPRPLNLQHTLINLGISKTQDHQPTCKFGKLTTDGSKCSDMSVILSEMREDNMLVSKTKRTSSFRKPTVTPGQDGMSDTSRMNRLTKQVSIIQVTDSIATESSTLSQREMANTCHLLVDKS